MKSLCCGSAAPGQGASSSGVRFEYLRERTLRGAVQLLVVVQPVLGRVVVPAQCFRSEVHKTSFFVRQIGVESTVEVSFVDAVLRARGALRLETSVLPSLHA